MQYKVNKISVNREVMLKSVAIMYIFLNLIVCQEYKLLETLSYVYRYIYFFNLNNPIEYSTFI